MFPNPTDDAADRELRNRILRQVSEMPAHRLRAVGTHLDRLLAQADTDSTKPATIQTGASCGTPWPHAPVHRLSEHGTLIVTGATYHKEHHFRGKQRLDYLTNRLLSVIGEGGWQLEAWAVFSNHYHFVAHATENCRKLDQLLKSLHGESAIEVNRLDDQPGRTVWFNYWDTELTYLNSYLARLHYVHTNPVRHGLVKAANQYRWCSAGWFERTARPAEVKTIYSFGLEKVKVRDDFEPVL